MDETGRGTHIIQQGAAEEEGAGGDELTPVVAQRGKVKKARINKYGKSSLLMSFLGKEALSRQKLEIALPQQGNTNSVQFETQLVECISRQADSAKKALKECPKPRECHIGEDSGKGVAGLATPSAEHVSLAEGLDTALIECNNHTKSTQSLDEAPEQPSEAAIEQCSGSGKNPADRADAGLMKYSVDAKVAALDEVQPEKGESQLQQVTRTKTDLCMEHRGAEVPVECRKPSAVEPSKKGLQLAQVFLSPAERKTRKLAAEALQQVEVERHEAEAVNAVEQTETGKRGRKRRSKSESNKPKLEGQEPTNQANSRPRRRPRKATIANDCKEDNDLKSLSPQVEAPGPTPEPLCVQIVASDWDTVIANTNPDLPEVKDIGNAESGPALGQSQEVAENIRASECGDAGTANPEGAALDEQKVHVEGGLPLAHIFLSPAEKRTRKLAAEALQEAEKEAQAAKAEPTANEQDHQPQRVSRRRRKQEDEGAVLEQNDRSRRKRRATKKAADDTAEPLPSSVQAITEANLGLDGVRVTERQPEALLDTDAEDVLLTRDQAVELPKASETGKAGAGLPVASIFLSIAERKKRQFEAQRLEAQTDDLAVAQTQRKDAEQLKVEDSQFAEIPKTKRRSSRRVKARDGVLVTEPLGNEVVPKKKKAKKEDSSVSFNPAQGEQRKRKKKAVKESKSPAPEGPVEALDLAAMLRKREEEHLEAIRQSRVDVLKMSAGKATHPFFIKKQDPCGDLPGPQGPHEQKPLLEPSAPLHVTQQEFERVPIHCTSVPFREPIANRPLLEFTESLTLHQRRLLTPCAGDLASASYQIPEASYVQLTKDKQKDKTLRALTEYLLGTDGLYPSLSERCLQYEKKAATERSLEECEKPKNAQWLDKYRPSSAAEVCGNPVAVSDIHRWLKEWSDRIASELQKEPKVKVKPARKVKRGQTSESEDTWLTENSDDSEDEDGLGNVLMISGPIGAGKTAAVYAIAHELGFQILETNASDKRSGALILQKLGEATESRGLTKWSNQPKVDELKGQPAVLPELRKQADPPDELVKTVVLFEECDQLLDEDRGFLAAVSNLASTSKRPIILTCNDPAAVGRCADVSFESLALADIITHVCLVCAAEGIAVDPLQVEHLVRECRQDIRRVFQELQFWAQGGLPADVSKARNPDVSVPDWHVPGVTPERAHQLFPALVNSSQPCQVSKELAERATAWAEQQQAVAEGLVAELVLAVAENEKELAARASRGKSKSAGEAKKAKVKNRKRKSRLRKVGEGKARGSEEEGAGLSPQGTVLVFPEEKEGGIIERDRVNNEVIVQQLAESSEEGDVIFRRRRRTRLPQTEANQGQEVEEPESLAPTLDPTRLGTTSLDPNPHPSLDPTPDSSLDPTPEASLDPTSLDPSPDPSLGPTGLDSSSRDPTPDPSLDPTPKPSLDPTPDSSLDPTTISSVDPIVIPSLKPAPTPSQDPSRNPLLEPSMNIDSVLEEELVSLGPPYCLEPPVDSENVTSLPGQQVERTLETPQGVGPEDLGVGSQTLDLDDKALGLGSQTLGLESQTPGLGSQTLGLGCQTLGLPETLGSQLLGLGSQTLGLDSLGPSLGSSRVASVRSQLAEWWPEPFVMRDEKMKGKFDKEFVQEERILRNLSDAVDCLSVGSVFEERCCLESDGRSLYPDPPLEQQVADALSLGSLKVLSPEGLPPAVAGALSSAGKALRQKKEHFLNLDVNHRQHIPRDVHYSRLHKAVAWVAPKAATHTRRAAFYEYSGFMSRIVRLENEGRMESASKKRTGRGQVPHTSSSWQLPEDCSEALAQHASYRQGTHR